MSAGLDERQHPKGSRHPRAVLTEAQAAAIAASRGSYSKIAREYGVSKTTVAMIRTGQIWKHVQPHVDQIAARDAEIRAKLLAKTEAMERRAQELTDALAAKEKDERSLAQAFPSDKDLKS